MTSPDWTQLVMKQQTVRTNRVVRYRRSGHPHADEDAAPSTKLGDRGMEISATESASKMQVFYLGNALGHSGV